MYICEMRDCQAKHYGSPYILGDMYVCMDCWTWEVKGYVWVVSGPKK